MKIGFCASVPFSGGGERIQNMLVEEFDKLGHQVIIYTWDDSWNKLKNNFPATINVLQSPPIGINGKVLAYKELKKSLLQDKPDCLLVFSLYLAEIAVLAARLAKIPFITSERVDPFYLPTSRLHRILRKITYSLSSGVVFQTNEVKAFFSRKIQEKSIVIQNPIIDDGLPIPQINKCRNEIVAVGRLSEEKRFSMLIEAFGEISHLIPQYSLKIYGDGPLYQELHNLIESRKISSKVFLMGKVNRVVDYISESDIFVLSSSHEGMPNALIEAMAMGLACIATDVRSGGTRALVNNGINGLLVPVEDKESLKNAILRLANNEPFKNELKTNAVNIIHTNSKDNILPLWITFILSKCR